MNLIRTFLICALVSLAVVNGNAMQNSYAQTAKEFGSKVYDFAVEQGQVVATATKDFAVENSKSLYTQVCNHPYISAGIAAGLVATGIAAKYASPYVKWAAIRAKINAQRAVAKCTPYADAVKQGAIKTAKIAAVGTVLALPVIAAYADAYNIGVVINQCIERVASSAAIYSSDKIVIGWPRR